MDAFREIALPVSDSGSEYVVLMALGARDTDVDMSVRGSASKWRTFISEASESVCGRLRERRESSGTGGKGGDGGGVASGGSAILGVMVYRAVSYGCSCANKKSSSRALTVKAIRSAQVD